MRFLIIGLAFIFLILSTLIVYRAFKLPTQVPVAHTPIPAAPLTEEPVIQEPMSQSKPETLSTGPALTPDNSTEPIESLDNASADAASQELNIAQLDIQVTTPEKTADNSKSAENDYSARILTVFSGQTFRSGHAIINDAAASKIEKLINEISVFPNSQIIIEGHTDNIPTGKSHKSNMDLSVQRAKAIADILISRGISPESISVVGYGDTRPIDTNRTEAGRANNRRVEVKLMLKKGDN
ncbi:MAG: OmpA family protein [Nitrosomonas sp.]|nr:MAG: OmpA family protein [Nitrosomonas sp.]